MRSYFKLEENIVKPMFKIPYTIIDRADEVMITMEANTLYDNKYSNNLEHLYQILESATRNLTYNLSRLHPDQSPEVIGFIANTAITNSNKLIASSINHNEHDQNHQASNSLSEAHHPG